MARSKVPCFQQQPVGAQRWPARSRWSLGMYDQGDPNFTSLLGDTAGSLGMNDYADPSLGCHIPGALSPLNGPTRLADGSAVSVGQDARQTVAATRDPVLWAVWRPPADYAVLFEMLVANEGNISHMYLDSKNKVTVGIGSYLPTVDDARRLRFYNRKTQLPATAAEIEADFNAVTAAKPDPKLYPKGRVASAYEASTQLDMTPADIGAQWLADVKKFQGYLPAEFAGFSGYPAEARQALTDIAYQYGAHGAAVNFAGGKLREHAEKGDWLAAAADCDSVAAYADRNAKRQALFRSAAKAASLKAAGSTAPGSTSGAKP